MNYIRPIIAFIFFTLLPCCGAEDGSIATGDIDTDTDTDTDVDTDKDLKNMWECLICDE